MEAGITQSTYDKANVAPQPWTPRRCGLDRPWYQADHKRYKPCAASDMVQKSVEHEQKVKDKEVKEHVNKPTTGSGKELEPVVVKLSEDEIPTQQSAKNEDSLDLNIEEIAADSDKSASPVDCDG